MSKLFPHLFSPGHIGNLKIKNRILKAPQSTGMSNMDGSVSERLIRYYTEQAKGGTGLIVVEYAYVDDIASKSAHCHLGVSSNEHIPGLAWLAETIMDQGARAGIQIEHCGRQKFLGTPPIVSASPMPWPALYNRVGLDAVPHELSILEIQEIVEAFGNAAKRAASAGFELVEIHGAHGYLLTNFFSPHTNKRTDWYGGSLENRMRIYVEIARNIRKKIGADFPLTIRLSGTDYEPDGFPVEDTIVLAKVLENEGINAIHVSGGDHHQMIHQVSPMAMSVCHNTWAADAIKKEVRIPIIASGSITLPKYAEEIISSGKADFVGLGRPLWADPYWPMKAQQDRPEDIRPCIRCNEGCLERTFFQFKAITCAVNPTISREGQLDITPAEQLKKVAVVGGGPAGMEAARVSKLRGHEVVLFESRKLGGALHEASIPEFKADIRPLLQNLVTQIEKLGIPRMEISAEVSDLKGFDTVVVAIGGKNIQLNLPGVDKSHVVSGLDVLNHPEKAGENIVVIGGGLVGTETALFLAESGKKVTVVEMLDGIMNDVAVTDCLAYTERIAKTDMDVLVRHKLVEIKDGSVLLECSGRLKELEADTVVMAVGFKPQNALVDELNSIEGLEVYAIGDCVKPAKIYDAIHAGYKTGLKI